MYSVVSLYTTAPDVESINPSYVAELVDNGGVSINIYFQVSATVLILYLPPDT